MSRRGSSPRSPRSATQSDGSTNGLRSVASRGAPSSPSARRKRPRCTEQTTSWFASTASRNGQGWSRICGRPWDSLASGAKPRSANISTTLANRLIPRGRRRCRRGQLSAPSLTRSDRGAGGIGRLAVRSEGLADHRLRPGRREHRGPARRAARREDLEGACCSDQSLDPPRLRFALNG